MTWLCIVQICSCLSRCYSVSFLRVKYNSLSSGIWWIRNLLEMFAFRRSHNTLRIHENRKRIDPDWLSSVLRFIWKVFPFKDFSFFSSFLSLSILGSRKDYFNVNQLENHGPNYAEDNPRKLKQTTRCTSGAVSTRILQEIYSLRTYGIFFSITNIREARRLLW